MGHSRRTSGPGAAAARWLIVPQLPHCSLAYHVTDKVNVITCYCETWSHCQWIMQLLVTAPTNNIPVFYGALQVLYCIVLYCIVLYCKIFLLLFPRSQIHFMFKFVKSRTTKHNTVKQFAPLDSLWNSASNGTLVIHNHLSGRSGVMELRYRYVA